MTDLYDNCITFFFQWKNHERKGSDVEKDQATSYTIISMRLKEKERFVTVSNNALDLAKVYLKVYAAIRIAEILS